MNHDDLDAQAERDIPTLHKVFVRTEAGCGGGVYVAHVVLYFVFFLFWRPPNNCDAGRHVNKGEPLGISHISSHLQKDLKSFLNLFSINYDKNFTYKKYTRNLRRVH